MIKSGLFNQLVNNATLQSLLTSPIANSISFVRAPKVPGDRFIVLHVINAPPADTTMDGTSELTLGELQFDSYADDADPNNASIATDQISAAIRATFENFVGTLVDGTTISFIERPFEFDDGYEEGAKGYLSRKVLRLRAFWSEAGQPGPQPPVNLMAIPFHLVSQNGTNSQQIKATPGNVLGAFGFRTPTNSYPAYVKLFDKATAPNPATGDVPRLVIPIEAGQNAIPVLPEAGIPFASGIWMMITLLPADNDVTPIAADDVIVDIYYQ